MLPWSVPRGDNVCQVFSISRPEWQCRIREGMAGMIRAAWAPDCRHVITFADFNLHLSVWSLTTRQVCLSAIDIAPKEHATVGRNEAMWSDGARREYTCSSDGGVPLQRNKMAPEYGNFFDRFLIVGGVKVVRQILSRSCPKTFIPPAEHH